MQYHNVTHGSEKYSTYWGRKSGNAIVSVEMKVFGNIESIIKTQPSVSETIQSIAQDSSGKDKMGMKKYFSSLTPFTPATIKRRKEKK